MKLAELNLNHFKVFLAVYESRSMTVAADSLHLTQSGVSQHMKSLEKSLGVPLFTRVGRRLIPTPAAAQLFPDLLSAHSQIALRIACVTGQAREPEGVVRIGMPIEFGNNVVIPKLAAIGQRYKKLTFEITLDYGSTLSRLVTEGQLDFAYVDETPLERRLDYKPVGSENLLLCGSPAYVKGFTKVRYTQSDFERFEYIEYTGTEPVLRRWMLHHLKRRNLRLRVRAHIMDVQGLAKFVVSGLGLGVLPDHLVDRLKKDGVELFVFEGKGRPLRNEIRLIRLRGHPLSWAAEATALAICE